MALTNQQVQAAYLAVIGRPAEGSAVEWASTQADLGSLVSTVIDIRKGADFANDKTTFVENLYENLLGRASDSEGLAFWVEQLDNGASYADVATAFVNAVLGQSQTADLYTLQNKLAIAEKISEQVKTFQGGAAAEQSLKDIMTNVDANTTAETADSLVSDFKAQYVDITNVTVKPGAEEPTEGSDEHATVFNASITLGGDDISIADASQFADTLNLSVKGVKDEATDLNSIGNVAGIKTLNITTGANVKTVTLDTDNIGGAKDLTIKGSAKSTITVVAGNDVSSITTGTASDYIDISNATNAVSVNGGAGIDTVVIGGNSTKATLTSIEKIAGNGNLSVAQLNGKTFTLGYTDDTGATDAAIAVNKVGSAGLNLSNLKITDGTNNTFALNDVKGGTIKLVKTDSLGNSTVDTITILEDAKKVEILNIDDSDSIVFGKLNGFSGAGGDALTAANGVKLADKTAYSFVMDTGTITNTDTVAKALKDASVTATTNKAAAVFVTNSNKTAVYLIENDGTAAIVKGELNLLATFDHATATSNELDNTGTFTFA